MNKEPANKYILNPKGQPQLVKNLSEWVKWNEEGESAILENIIDDVVITTLFLGYDVDEGEYKTPSLWETIAASPKEILISCKCAGTREQAEAMHVEVTTNIFRESLVMRINNGQ